MEEQLEKQFYLVTPSGWRIPISQRFAEEVVEDGKAFSAVIDKELRRMMGTEVEDGAHT